MAKIVLPIRGAPPPEPPYGGLGEGGWARGLTFYDLVQRFEEHRAELERSFRDCPVSPELMASLASYPRPVRVLALLDPSDSPSRRFVARAERLFTLSTRIWMRLFDAQSCADLVTHYAPAREDLPVLVFFGDDQREFARYRLSDVGSTAAATRPEPASGEPSYSAGSEPSDSSDDPSSLLQALQRLLELHAAPPA